MTATLKTTVIQEPSSATANLTLNTSGGVTVGQNLTVAGTLSGAVATNVQTFNLAGSPHTWTKPAGTWNFYKVQMWGGGGSGGKGTSTGGGGGGGYWEFNGPISDFGATSTVTVGAGGASRTVANTAGDTGGTSSVTLTGISKTLSVYGGGGGGSSSAVQPRSAAGGSGGSIVGAGFDGNSNTETNNFPYEAKDNLNYTYPRGPDAGFGGGAGATAGVNGGTGSNGTTGGGGGGGGAGDATAGGGSGGNSVFGGAGGGANGQDSSPGAGVGGTSLLGGNGGAGAFDANNAIDGSVPGGGGGGAEIGNSGAGGAGRVIITVY